MSAESDVSFEQIVQRMESIAKQLEGGQVKLEVALALFEEGVRLSKVGTARLDEAERRLEVLLEGDKVGELKPRGEAPQRGDDVPF